MRLDRAMHSVDEQHLLRTFVAFLDFLKVSSFFYSYNCSRSALAKNWRLCTGLAASACKICMRLVASRI